MVATMKVYLKIPTSLKVFNFLAIVTVPFLANGQTTWTGTTSNDWNTAANWSNGVPNDPNNWPVIIDLDGAVVNMSAPGSGRDIRVSGNGTTAPVLNITEDLSVSFNQFTVGSVDSSGAGATGYNGIVNHTSGTLSIGGTSGTRRLRVAGAGSGGGGTSTYNFGGASSSAPVLDISGGANGDVLLGNGSSETGNLNLSGYGTFGLSGDLEVARANGTANIGIVGENLSINVGGNLEFSEFGSSESFLNVTIDSAGFSTINVTGNTSFGLGDADFNLSLNSFTPTVGATYTIISSTGFTDLQSSGNTTFSNVADGSTISAGGTDFVASYSSGDFVLTVVPEPEAAGLGIALAAVALVSLRRRR